MKIRKPVNRGKAPNARTIQGKTRTVTGRKASRSPKWCHLFTEPTPAPVKEPKPAGEEKEP